MAPQKRTLAATEANNQVSEEPKRVKSKASTAALTEPMASSVQPVPVAPGPVPGVEFVTFARPCFDRRAEQEDDESIDPESREAEKALDKQHDEDLETFTDKPIKDFPDHKWVVSKLGKALLEQYALQGIKCDQDSFGMHIYNDWTGYGQQEIMENMVHAIPLTMSSLVV
jgi:hypothetical protein